MKKVVIQWLRCCRYSLFFLLLLMRVICGLWVVFWPKNFVYNSKKPLSISRQLCSMHHSLSFSFYWNIFIMWLSCACQRWMLLLCVVDAFAVFAVFAILLQSDETEAQYTLAVPVHLKSWCFLWPFKRFVWIISVYRWPFEQTVRTDRLKKSIMCNAFWRMDRSSC